MSSHTPEPWEILTTNGKTYVVTNALSQPFVGQVIAGPTTCPDWESNARLIASAPDLLASLVELESMVAKMLPKHSPCGWGELALNQARQAIAKATENNA